MTDTISNILTKPLPPRLSWLNEGFSSKWEQPLISPSSFHLSDAVISTKMNTFSIHGKSFHNLFPQVMMKSVPSYTWCARVPADSPTCRLNTLILMYLSISPSLLGKTSLLFLFSNSECASLFFWKINKQIVQWNNTALFLAWKADITAKAVPHSERRRLLLIMFKCLGSCGEELAAVFNAARWKVFIQE